MLEKVENLSIKVVAMLKNKFDRFVRFLCIHLFVCYFRKIGHCKSIEKELKKSGRVYKKFVETKATYKRKHNETKAYLLKERANGILRADFNSFGAVRGLDAQHLKKITSQMNLMEQKAC